MWPEVNQATSAFKCGITEIPTEEKPTDEVIIKVLMTIIQACCCFYLLISYIKHFSTKACCLKIANSSKNQLIRIHKKIQLNFFFYFHVYKMQDISYFLALLVYSTILFFESNSSILFRSISSLSSTTTSNSTNSSIRIGRGKRKHQ